MHCIGSENQETRSQQVSQSSEQVLVIFRLFCFDATRIETCKQQCFDFEYIFAYALIIN